ncbi:LolA family protein [Terriglobus sp.]|uniref:LolA family protein n=1 Tax=Terriglobus sp. TaxID=1889013 RepID=UPI003B00C49C
MALTFLATATTSRAQSQDPLTLAKRVDAHYNHLSSLRATYSERYSGMGQTREEHGTLLLKKPGRMRWTYNSGKLFVLDGKFATSYTPGDTEAQRIPAKQLDDLRSPLRFLLGHTELEKELDHLTTTPSPEGTTLTGTPHYRLTPGTEPERIQAIAVTVDSATGQIHALRITEIDESTTEFHFAAQQENAPVTDADFRFQPPTGVTVVDGLPPS